MLPGVGSGHCSPWPPTVLQLGFPEMIIRQQEPVCNPSPQHQDSMIDLHVTFTWSQCRGWGYQTHLIKFLPNFHLQVIFVFWQKLRALCARPLMVFLATWQQLKVILLNWLEIDQIPTVYLIALHYASRTAPDFKGLDGEHHARLYTLGFSFFWFSWAQPCCFHPFRV